VRAGSPFIEAGFVITSAMASASAVD